MSWKNALQAFADKIKSKSSSRDDSNLGSQTQFSGTTKDSQNKQIVCGLDFGTAFTKVVLGDDRVRYAVPFRKEVGGVNSYLLPCRYWVDEAGVCSLVREQGRQISTLKMRMLDGDFGISLQIELCAFLALVLKQTRSYFFSEYEATYQKNYIRWLVNIGLPTSSYHDKKLVSFYKKVVQAAWRVSIQGEPVTFAVCTDMLSKYGDTEQITEDLQEDMISPFPEFVAQITGYVRSPLRNDDLHFLVDVGAGTVDATVFNVHQVDGEDLFPIFAKMVEPLGTQHLVENRLAQAGKSQINGLSAFENIPRISDFAALLNKDVQSLKNGDKKLKNSLTSGLVELLKYTKRRRYPLSQTWKNGIPTFLCGGGCNCDFYVETILSSKTFGSFKLIPKKLPKPENLKADGVESVQYSRLSVAYGLSFDPFDIGEILRMENVEDVFPEEINPNSTSAGKSASVFCKKCGGTGGLHGFCEACGGSGFEKVQ